MLREKHNNNNVMDTPFFKRKPLLNDPQNFIQRNKNNDNEIIKKINYVILNLLGDLKAKTNRHIICIQVEGKHFTAFR